VNAVKTNSARSRRCLVQAVASLVLAASLAACGSSHTAPVAQAPYVGTTVATQGMIVPGEQLAGIIAPYQNVAISSTLTEPADTVNVQEGDVVHRGEVLAQLDTADLVASLQSDVAQAQSDQAATSHNKFAGTLSIDQGVDSMRSAQTAVKQAQENLERDAQAAVASAVSNVAANGPSLNAPGLQSSTVQSSQATEQVALANANQERVQIAKATIVSPIDGVVVNRNLNPGEYPGTRQIFTLQQVNPIYAILHGSGQQIAQIATGAPATIVSTDSKRSQRNGKVAGVLNQIVPGSTDFQVKVVMQNADGSLRPGMAVSGSVRLAGVHGVRVPETAFTDDSHDAVMTVQNGTVKTVQVTEIAGDGMNSIVSGIDSGTRVVCNGQTSIGDGEKVAIR
jgi:HlyD family secretion protein